MLVIAAVAGVEAEETPDLGCWSCPWNQARTGRAGLGKRENRWKETCPFCQKMSVPSDIL